MRHKIAWIKQQSKIYIDRIPNHLILANTPTKKCVKSDTLLCVVKRLQPHSQEMEVPCIQT